MSGAQLASLPDSDFPGENPNVRKFRYRESNSTNAPPNATGDSGPYQINAGTLADAARYAGIDLHGAKNASDLPIPIQTKLANALYAVRGEEPWRSSDPAYLAAKKANEGLGGYGPEMVSRAMGDISGIFNQKEAALAPIVSDIQKQYQQDKLRFDKAAENYTPVQDTKPPQPPPNDPLAGFASAGALFASIAAAFTHTPAIAAMNGMSSAINAYKAGNWEQYQANYKQWKDNTELAIEKHKLQAEDMKNALETMQTNLSTGVARAKVAAMMSDDRIGMVLLQTGQWEKLAELQDARNKSALDMQQKALQIEQLHQTIQEKKELDDATSALTKANQSGDPDAIAQAEARIKELMMRNPSFAMLGLGLKPQSKSAAQQQEFQTRFSGAVADENAKRAAAGAPLMNDFEKANLYRDMEVKEKTAEAAALTSAKNAAEQNLKPLSDEAVDFQARMFLSTRKMPSGWNRPAQNQIMNKAAEIASQEHHTVNDYITGSATLHANEQSLAAVTKQKNAAAGYENGAIRAFDFMISMIPNTPEPLNMQTLTRWVRTGETEFGDVNVAAWQASLITALDEYAKVLSGATGAQGSTEGSRALALRMIPEGSTSAQIVGIVNAIKTDMKNKVSGYDDTIADIQSDIRGQAGAAKTTGGGASSEQPPVPGAQKAPDGKWYVKKDGKIFRVDP